MREFRKPLVVMSPKSLLRHRLVKSDIEDFSEGTTFQRYFGEAFPDTLVADDKIRKVGAAR